MFKFLFGRGRALRYDVFYTLKGSTWTMKATLLAGSEYEANLSLIHISSPRDS